MFIDDTGTCACKYDGTVCDFRRLEAGLPPRACPHQNKPETHAVYGIGVSGNLAFGASVSGSLEYAYDFKEERPAVLATISGGGGLPNASAGVSFSIYNVPSIDSLEKESVPITMAIGPISYQLTIIHDSHYHETYYGHTITLSLICLSLPIDFAGEIAYTWNGIEWDTEE